MSFTIDPEFQGLIPPLNDLEFEQLEANVVAEGCRDALVVWQESGLLLDGHNRYNICAANDIAFETASVSLPSRESAINWIVDNQLGRRNLTPHQASYLRGKRFNSEPKEPGKRNDLTSEQNDPRLPLADRLGAQHGVSPATIKRDAKFADSVDLFEPDTKREILSGKNEYRKQDIIAAQGEKGILEAARRIRVKRANERRADRTDKINHIAQNNRPLDADLDQLYPVIYADPPWRYEHAVSVSREIENQYPTMSLEEICALPVGSIATPDSVLFLWATSPKLAESMQVIEAWGYNYRTCFVWDKERVGMGYYARQQHELLLIATRGKPPAPAPETRCASVVRIRRDNEHSAKPARFYEIIEAMYPAFGKIELFARNARPNWASWGNQSNGCS